MKATTWLIPLAGVGAVALALALWARQAVATQRAQAWGITRSVEAFLAEVRAHRAAFQALPAEPPTEGYACLPRLTSFTVQLKGADETWMELDVQGPSLLDQVRGEGLHLLHFASRREALFRAEGGEASALNAAHWKRYQAVLAELGSPEGARALWQREPGLHGAYPRPEDLMTWRDEQLTFLGFAPPGAG